MVLALLATRAGPALAQETGRIEGRVSLPDGTGLDGAVVGVAGLKTVGLTDGNGDYALENVPAGVHTLTFNLLDRAASQAGVRVDAGATVTVDLMVDWVFSSADTVTVFAASRRLERITEAPAAVTVVGEREIARRAAAGQVPKLLEFTPGVDFTQSGLYDFNFNTRGFNSSLNRRILTLIDGRDPAIPFLGAQEWAAISFPLDELATVELVRGPGSALYGANAFNGVLNLTTKEPRANQGGRIRLAGGELSTRRADLRYATGFGNDWYVRAVGGYQRSDDFTLSRDQSVEYSTFCTSPGQTDCLRREARGLELSETEIGFGGLRLDRYFSESQLLTIEGGTAVFEGPTGVTGIGRVQATDVNRPWARVNFNTPHWNFLGYYDERNAEDQVALFSGALLFEHSAKLHGEIQGNTRFAGGRGFVVGGIAYQQQKIDTANDEGVQTLMAEERDEDQQAVFGQLQYTFTDRFKAVVAARVDESTLHATQFSPKASLVYRFHPNHRVRLTYNEAFQVPNFSEFFLRAPAGAPITAFAPLEEALAPVLGGRSLGLRSIPIRASGNEALQVEEIASYEAGYAGILSDKFFVTLDYYRNDVENFVTDLLPGVNPAFTLYTPPTFLPEAVATQILATLRQGLGANFAGLTTVDDQPTLVLSFTNAGVVDTQGFDVGLHYSISDRWLADFSYSWFDFKVREHDERDQLLPNAPENKVSAGLAFTGGRFDASVKYRWVDAFEWAAGIFVGSVPAYHVVDVSARYAAAENLQIGLDFSNLFDDEQFQSFGGDLLERRALGFVTFTW